MVIKGINLNLKTRLSLVIGICGAILGFVFVYFAISNTTTLVEEKEAEELKLLSGALTTRIELQLASTEIAVKSIANNIEVERVFAARDREELLQMLLPIYEAIKGEITQFQFHLPDSHSFLRIHLPQQYGDDLSSFRYTVNMCNTTQQPVLGLEEGVGGLGLRVVLPMFYQGRHTGSVEYGAEFGQLFLEGLQQDFGGTYYMYIFDETNGINGQRLLYAVTNQHDQHINELQDCPKNKKQVQGGTTVYCKSADEKYNLVYVPFQDYAGKTKGYITIVLDRQEVLGRLNTMRNYMNMLAVLGTAGILILAITVVSRSKELLGLVKESTQRKKAEEEVNKLYLAIEQIPSSVIITNTEGKIEYVNSRFLQLTGYAPVDVMGKYIFHLNLGEYEKNQHNPIWSEVLATGHWRGELKNSKKTGEQFWEQASITLIKNTLGITTHLLKVSEDITERKEIEKKLTDYTAEIEKIYQKIKNDVDKAHQLHQQFFPKNFPVIAEVHFAAYNKPAENLGGDFYQVQDLGENQLLIYLSDVSGHGLDGAMLNIFVKNTVDNFISLQHLEGNRVYPTKLLEYVANQYSKENFPDDYFLCLLAVVYDVAKKQLLIGNAGFQINPQIVSKQGEITVPCCSGLPISKAIEPSILQYSQTTVTVAEGTTVFFTTDGLIEEHVKGEDYGEKRLQQVLQKNHNLSPEWLVEAVNEDFFRFSGNLQGKDDITFLAMQIHLMPKARLNIQIPSSIEGVEMARAKVEPFLRAYFEETYWQLMCLYEMIVNGVEHGNKFNKEKLVTVEIDIIDLNDTTPIARMVVSDEGNGFDWYSQLRELDVDSGDFSERGRGIKIAKTCCSQILYNKKGNKVLLVK